MFEYIMRLEQLVETCQRRVDHMFNRMDRRKREGKLMKISSSMREYDVKCVDYWRYPAG